MQDVREVTDSKKKTHGVWEKSSEFYSALKKLLLDALTGRGKAINSKSRDLAVSMICVKLSRIACGDCDEPEHWVDIAGYAMLHHNLLVKDVETPSDFRTQFTNSHEYSDVS